MQENSLFGASGLGLYLEPKGVSASGRVTLRSYTYIYIYIYRERERETGELA